MRIASFAALSLALLACNTGAPKEMTPEPASTTTTTTSEAKPAATLKLGAALDDKAQKVALAEVAKNPDAYVGKTFATTGTVTAVCQHMGCWMEIKDDAGEAHIRMAGHSFFVPKTASGKKARVMATLVKGNEPMCAEDGTKKGCRAEAEQALGRPLAKLELVAQGVEIL
jgi:Rieske Fe-S protein